MKKNTNIGILALVVLDAIANALNEKTSTSMQTKKNLPTTEPKNAVVTT